jgi:subtilisin family serine protease
VEGNFGGLSARLRARRPWIALAVAVTGLCLGIASAAGGPGPDAVPADLGTNAVPLGAQSGQVTLAVNLTQPSLAQAAAAGASSADEQHAQLTRIKSQQSTVSSRIDALGGSTVASLTNALNAVVVQVDRKQIGQIEALPDVSSARIVRDYELALAADDQTVSYIGAAAAQAAGKDGAGVTVAILDTGTDYTHHDLGGSGTSADFVKAYGTSLNDPRNTTIDASVFPTAKVIGGYDFIGENWVSGGTAHPDPNPIDCSPSAVPAITGCAGGHGTHVADILAGVEDSPGTAPGAKILSYKVCSTLSTSCSGVALLQAVDRAMDPNEDGSVADHADVISLSLGSPYGQDQDDLTAALNNAVDAGAIAVAAAGNNGNLPYVVSSPSSGANVISVAQTQVPEASGYAVEVNTPAGLGPFKNTASLDWAPVGSTDVTGDVVYLGRACPGDTLLGNPAGKIALVDRGSCAVSLKTDVAGAGGAIGVLVGLVAPGDPIAFSYGGGTHMVPTLVLTQADAGAIKTALAGGTVNVTFGPSTKIALVGSMASTSARGPTFSRSTIKPDVGAPGAAVSADAGSGNHTSAFGGTSGATPVISGSAAILHGAYPNRAPYEIKSLLMNTAFTDLKTNPLLSDELAPITRIGGGEVRVDKALASTTAAWDSKDRAGSLSFGYLALSRPAVLNRQVVVRNYSNSAITYAVSSTFRYANDQATGAVTLATPASVTVPANGSATFNVQMTVDPSKLAAWSLNGGSLGGSGARLNANEYDGFVWLDGGSANSRVHLAWQVLPHRAAAVSSDNNVKAGSTLQVRNASTVQDATVEAFALTGTSGQYQKKVLPTSGDNFAVIDLKSVGVRQNGSAVQFGIATYGTRAHPSYPAEFDVYIDSNNDGTPDYVVFNLENGGVGTSGQSVVEVYNLATSRAVGIFYYVDADLNSGNAILTAPLAAVGLTPSTTFTYSVYAFDDYFTGALTDAIENMTFTLGAPKYALPAMSFTVPAAGKGTLPVTSVGGGATASPSQLGFQLLVRDADANTEEAQTVLVG